MTKKKQAELERSASLAELRELIKPGDTVYSVLRHVSRSGMSRAISFYVYQDNKPFQLDYHISKVCGYSLHRKYEGLSVGGCGMDMGFSVVYNLSDTLYGGIGYKCLGEKCPSNYHVNGGEMGKETLHRDGYAVGQRWQ